MRKIVAILFLLILCFNIIGYRYVFILISAKADSKLELQIDNFNYDESQLVEIRVDLSNPYQERYTEFERQYGEITIDGKPHTYVMRKIEGSILILKCIKNIIKEKVWNTSDELTKANSNQDQNNTPQKQNTGLLKLIKSDYINNSFFVVTSLNSNIENTRLPYLEEKLPMINLLPPQQPPRC